MNRFLKPIPIYGSGILLLWVGQIIIYGEDHLNVGYFFQFLLPPVIVAALIGHTVHLKFSRFRLWGGILGGLTVIGLSIALLALGHFLIGWWNQDTVWFPYLSSALVLYYGSMIGLPLGVISGSAYYSLFIKYEHY